MVSRRSFIGGTAGLLGASAIGWTAGSASAQELSRHVHAFYYPWYGSPDVNGGWRHWEQGGHAPPEDIGADYYPTLGPYDSGDFDGAVTQHMAWLAQAGVGVIVYSWWGRQGYEDGLANGVLDVAAEHGIEVAWHIEPYTGRTAASVVDDIGYVNGRYGEHPAYYRATDQGNRPAFYIFNSLEITNWAPLDQVTGDNIVLAQTTDTTKVEHFSGLFTYDAIAGATAPGWSEAGAYAKANGLIWAPSVGPGYIDDRAVPGNTSPTLGRDNGETYDLEWRNALAAATGGPPTWVSITSFNEWHEGSQLEPTRSSPPGGFGYLSYDGAYGKTGEAAETAYLDRTRHWVTEFENTRGKVEPRL